MLTFLGFGVALSINTSSESLYIKMIIAYNKSYYVNKQFNEMRLSPL